MPKDYLTLIGLGGCQEVGRSCFLLKSPNSLILLDCGVLFASLGKSIAPSIEQVTDPSKIDAIVLTHAHLDHAGYIPALFDLGFKGPVISTSETAALAKILWLDYRNLGPCSEFSMSGMESALSSFVSLGTTGSLPIGDFLVRFLRAGHIMGAVMANIFYKKISILYTGDISRDTIVEHGCSLHSKGYFDFVISEATYGNHRRPSNNAAQISSAIIECLSSGGTVLIPSFGVGRSQEVIATLGRTFGFRPEPNKRSLNEEKDSKTEKEHLRPFLKRPILAIDGMIKEVNNIYLEYRPNDPLLAFLREGKFTYVHDIGRERFLNTIGPKIIVSTGGMLEGLSGMYFNELCDDPDNLLLFVGYQARGTRGRHILDQPNSVKMNVKYFSLSAHADMDELKDILSGINTKCLYIVHGEEDACSSLLKAAAHFECKDSIVLKALNEQILFDSNISSNRNDKSVDIINSEALLKEANIHTNTQDELENLRSGKLFGLFSPRELQKYIDHTTILKEMKIPHKDYFHRIERYTKYRFWLLRAIKGLNENIQVCNSLLRLDFNAHDTIEMLKHIISSAYCDVPISYTLLRKDFSVAEALNIIRELSFKTKNYRGTIDLSDRIYIHLRSDLNATESIIELGKILESGPVSLSILYSDLRSDFNSNEAINQISFLLAQSAIGGGQIRFPADTYGKIRNDYLISDMFQKLGDILESGPVVFPISYDDIRIDLENTETINKIVYLIERIKNGSLKYLNTINNLMKTNITTELSKFKFLSSSEINKKKSTSQIVIDAFSKAYKDISSKSPSIVDISHSIYSKLRRDCSKEESIKELTKILNSGPVNFSIAYSDLRRDFQKEDCIFHLSKMARATKVGRGNIELPRWTYKELRKDFRDIDAVDNLGILLKSGPVCTSISFRELRRDFNSLDAIKHLSFWATKASRGQGSIELEKDFYKQVRDDHGSADTINMLGQVLASGPIIATLSYSDLRKDFYAGRTVDQLIHLAAKAKEGILMPLKNAIQQTKEMITSEQQSRKNQGIKKGARKSIESIAEEASNELMGFRKDIAK